MPRFAVFAFVVAGGTARAEPVEITPETIEVNHLAPGTEVQIMGGRSERSYARGWLVLPQGSELGGELRFVTAGPSLDAMPLAFSDVGILTLRARRALGGRAELYGAIDLLPKQPSYTDEAVWQGVTLGVNFQPWARRVALSLRATGGPLLSELGHWGNLAAGVQLQKAVHEIMQFEGGASLGGLAMTGEASGWIAEASVQASVLFHDPEGYAGAWIGIGYALPIAHRGDDPMSGASLDPQPRLDLGIGAVLSFVEHWDVFARFAVVDRGELSDPATRLPILDGGFDQRQLVLGVAYQTRP